MSDQIVQSLVPLLSGPVGIGIMIYIFKKKIDRLEEIPSLQKDIQFIKETLIEMKADARKAEKYREEQILLKSEVKAIWRHVDDLKANVNQ